MTDTPIKFEDPGNETGNQTAQTPKHRDLTRRKVVVAGAGAVAAVGVGGAVVATASVGETGKGASPKASSSTLEECYKLTSETTEGPYYIDADKIRRDITEDKEGIPLTLRLKVTDSESCKPIRNAAVCGTSSLATRAGHSAGPSRTRPAAPVPRLAARSVISASMRGHSRS